MIDFRYCSFLWLMFLPVLVVAQPLKADVEKPTGQQDISIEDFKIRDTFQYRKAPTILNPIRRKPGVALISSAIIPGSGQAANSKWLRAGAYLAAEALLLTVHFQRKNDARKQELRYEQFADNNWSVVTYARWLVNYHDENNLSNASLEELRNQVANIEPAYDTEVDWNQIDIELLRSIERNTPFIYPDRSGNNFSHVMPDYGSQQYYELISKYYQYGPGWRDFGNDQNGGTLDNKYKLNWDGSDMSPNFFRGSVLAEQFNDNYRIAGNMISLLILNHMVSAFDAFLSVRIRNNRLKAEANPFKLQSFSLKYHF